MTDVEATVTELVPIGGATNAGYKIGYLAAQTKAAQNDTVTIKNATAVIHADLQIVATGASETNTLSSNTITLTSATTGSVRGLVIYT